MRAFIYARVSTNDQTCENQLRELRSYCPLFAHDEIVALRDDRRHAVGSTNYASHKVRREPRNLHVVNVDCGLVDANAVVRNTHDLEHHAPARW